MEFLSDLGAERLVGGRAGALGSGGPLARGRSLGSWVVQILRLVSNQINVSTSIVIGNNSSITSIQNNNSTFVVGQSG